MKSYSVSFKIKNGVGTKKAYFVTNEGNKIAFDTNCPEIAVCAILASSFAHIFEDSTNYINIYDCVFRAVFEINEKSDYDT